MPSARRNFRLASLVALALAAGGCDRQSPEQQFEQAQALAQKADYAAAVIALKNVLQAQPDNSQARLLLGQVLVKQGAYRDGETELTKANALGVERSRLVPALARAYLMSGQPQKVLDLGLPESALSGEPLADLLATRAEAQLYLGKRDDVEQSILSSEMAYPDRPALRLVEAKLALFDGQAERAGERVDEALRRDPKFVDALYFKAGLRHAAGQLDEAAALYGQITAIDPSQVLAHLAAARVQLQKGDLDAADKAVKAAESLTPKNPLVMYSRGILELQRGHLDLASATLAKVLAVVPDDLASLLAHAVASHGLGNFEQSINKAKRVLARDADNLLATKILASGQLQSKDAKGALATLETALAAHPDDPQLVALAGDAYLWTGDYAKAMSYLNRAVALEPQSATIKTSRATGHLVAGNTEQALTDLEQAVRLNAQLGQADLLLVTLRLKRKEYDQALSDIAALEKKLPNNPVTHELRAGALVGQEDRAGARKALEQALAIQPTFFSAALSLARLDIQDGNPALARQRFESILARDEKNVEAMLALAELSAFEKKESEYLAWLDWAIRADPRQIKPRAALVQHHLARREMQKALAAAQDAAASNPDDVDAVSLLGSAQLAAGDSTAAIETFSGIARKLPQSPEAQLKLALAQITIYQTGAARATLNKALQLKPDFLPAQEALIRLELGEQKPDAALKIARQMQSRQARSPLGFDREGDIMLSQKRYPEAIKAYEKALEKGAATPGLIKLHRALALSGDSKAAYQRLDDWVRQYPRDLAIRAYAADVYMKARRDRIAIAHYEELLRLSPNNVVALGNLANLYLRENDSRALPTAELAFKLAPDDPRVFDILGWILVEQGQGSRGIDLLGKAAGQLPDLMSVRYHYGAALARAGKKAEARKELELVLAQEPSSSELREQAKKVLASL
ncbi:XrtA/PEP-CTERM system TPR-repeat protein PrsT [Accumulibacter sp.]|uniref:XrtA/PEP-CTERM system TPR-repeat protein PrsT n=1 Tax=Accumulibacter sp. TaxID=2053492 RepID=UPI00260309DB|nr:XrtA/PEP-CTERM system TPR-repeat protein PrsT [Accumulibacter sp.]